MKETRSLNPETELSDLSEAIEPSETAETDVPMTEEDLQEQYDKLPLWQHVLLVMLFLFGFTAVIMVINFIVDFGAELLRRLF